MNSEKIARALGGATCSAGTWKARCPAHNDQNPSLSISDPNGKILVHCHAGCSQDAVIDELIQLGLWPTRQVASDKTASTKKPKKPQWKPQVPVPPTAPVPKFVHNNLGKASAHWEYRDKSGRTLGYVMRFNGKDGRKTYRPATYCRNNIGVLSWRWQGFDDPLPLYGLDRLAKYPGARVVIAEGEKAADAVSKLLPDVVAISWPHGAKSAKRVDWSPLKDRSITIWPDADEQGEQAAREIASCLGQLGIRNVRTIKPPAHAPRGWDAADALDEGVPPDEISGLLQSANSPTPAGTDVNVGDIDAPEFSDDELALRVAAELGDELRYVHAWGKWLRWDGYRWSIDRTLEVFDYIRTICRTAAAECDKPKEKGSIASAKTIAAVERLAKSDRQHAATVEQWDTHPYVLPTPAGEIDLQIGKIGPAKPNRYMTKVTAVAPKGDCPRWLEFLEQITGGDKEMQLYLQRVVGYCLTGVTDEQALFFLYGSGQNGKGVFINTIAGILKEFHTAAPMETFLHSKTDRHPTELAGLRGARLVTCTEVEDGRRWDEAKIKALTGGDAISARFMRQDYFTFSPTFKLMISGNHKPSLSHVDKAISRRLHLIPFTVTIPDDERDDQLAEKLKAEWPGILRWAIEGAVEWSRTGLQPPEAVRVATQEYLSTQDSISQWIEECCTRGANEQETIADLWVSWRTWCDEAKDYSGKKASFVEALGSRGFARTRIGKKGAKGFAGIALTHSDELEIDTS